MAERRPLGQPVGRPHGPASPWGLEAGAWLRGVGRGCQLSPVTMVTSQRQLLSPPSEDV